MKLLAATVLSLSLVASASAHAQTITITRSGSQPSRQGPAENFTGSVRVEAPFGPNAPARTSGALVTFEPSARSAWHSHPLGQTLIVTAGIGLVQQWGDPIDEIRQGDIVWIPPNQKHWHGASPDSAMAHIAIVEQLDGKSTEWMEKVSDAQYGAPVRARESSSVAPASSAAATAHPTPATIDRRLLSEAGRSHRQSPVWRGVGTSATLAAGPQPRDRQRTDCNEPSRSAPISPRQSP